MEVRRLTNLARLMASVLAALALPATMLKVGRECWMCVCRFSCRPGAGMDDSLQPCGAVYGLQPAVQCALLSRGCAVMPPAPPQQPCALAAGSVQGFDFAAALTAREILFWRIFFEHLLAACKSAGESAAVFKRCVGLK